MARRNGDADSHLPANGHHGECILDLCLIAEAGVAGLVVQNMATKSWKIRESLGLANRTTGLGSFVCWLLIGGASLISEEALLDGVTHDRLACTVVRRRGQGWKGGNCNDNVGRQAMRGCGSTTPSGSRLWMDACWSRSLGLATSGKVRKSSCPTTQCLLLLTERERLDVAG